MQTIKPRKIPEINKETIVGTYLEVYIEENGKLIFTPVTRNTASVLSEISCDSSKVLPSIYCG
jgi:hypothetical protein